jgi:endonuclease YncB( thermonuclease family)
MKHGTAARDRLRQLTIRGVECRAEETDPYSRTVVRCRLPDGRDPAAVLVREGLAGQISDTGVSATPTTNGSPD